MKFFVAVLIAAVSVSCLVTAINGETATDTAAVPYIDMLLPPFEDVQDNSKDAVTENKVPAKVTPASTTTTTTTKKPTTTTTTKKPITNEVNNILPELSIEALLPPLFEAKIEQEETKTTSTKKPTTTTTTTTREPTTTTTTKTSTTSKSSTTTTVVTTVKPSKLEVPGLPGLILDSLLPPLLDNDIIDVKDAKIAATTQKPSLSIKTTKKSYYQQLKHLQTSTSKEAKNYNKPAATSSDAERLVAESKTHSKQVPLVSHKQNNKLQSKIETIAKQHEAEHIAQQRHSVGNSQHEAKQFNNNNYSFDLYFGSTTARPPKSGLPTITPFPHRLGR